VLMNVMWLNEQCKAIFLLEVISQEISRVCSQQVEHNLASVSSTEFQACVNINYTHAGKKIPLLTVKLIL
jgi:hypothetical protein